MLKRSSTRFFPPKRKISMIFLFGGKNLDEKQIARPNLPPQEIMVRPLPLINSATKVKANSRDQRQGRENAHAFVTIGFT